MPTQSKLLRVLEERRFERLGGNDTLSIDARLIALTNADLTHSVAAGTFREDLYFRLGVLTIKVPALRERSADVLPLAAHLLARLAAVHGRPDTTFSEASRKTLQAYSWPGNVRQLKNVIERALVFAKDSTLEPSDFPEDIRTTEAAIAGTMRSLEEIEREVIRATLEATHYKISRSAEILGISRKTLLDKRKRYGLQ
jgi:DNA-binding NtrC family response regulator